MCLAQLYVPAKMIGINEEIISKGKEFKFKTQPVDPSDPFVGKYIHLSFANRRFAIKKDSALYQANRVFVSFKEDSLGFAQIAALSSQKPNKNSDYLRLTNFYISSYRDSMKVSLTYPFSRYYMEESKAYPAELAYQKSATDTNSVTYALVSILDGKAVLKDVHIDGVSVKDVVTKKYLD